jgi:hypothetical protein
MFSYFQKYDVGYNNYLTTNITRAAHQVAYGHILISMPNPRLIGLLMGTTHG